MLKNFFSSFACCFSQQPDHIINNNPPEDSLINKNRDIHLHNDHYNTIEERNNSFHSDNLIKSKTHTPKHSLNDKSDESSDSYKIKALNSSDNSKNSDYERLLIDEKYIRVDEKDYITFVIQYFV